MKIPSLVSILFLAFCLILPVGGCVAAPTPLQSELSRERIACYVEPDRPDSDVLCPAGTVYVMAGDGSDRKEIGEGRYPAWSPDGRALVVVHGCLDDLYVLDVESGESSKLANPKNTYGVEGPSWSPDGDKIAFAIDYNSIWLVAADGSVLRELTKYGPGFFVDVPSWSPTGTKIAFALSEPGDKSCHIYVMNDDGSNLTQLTHGPGYNYGPIWSSRADRILFHSFNQGDGQIFVMNPDGSELTGLGRGIAHGWSPDGTRIYFQVGDGYLWTMNADGSNRTRLFRLNCDAPAWSPVLEEAD